MKILSIGNSFSQDAQRYLHGIAQAAGEPSKCVNLYLGGCTLKMHYENLFGNRSLYNVEINGEQLKIYVNIREVLVADEWDVITLQQQSLNSIDFETMRPYIKKIADEIRFICPKAKIFIHQTWGDETGAPRVVAKGFNTMAENFAAVKDSYFKAYDFISADGIIPSGEALLALSESGVKAHRDTFHASYGAGRYTIALTWFEVLFDKSCIGNSFRFFDEEIDEKTIALCQSIAEKCANEYKKYRR